MRQDMTMEEVMEYKGRLYYMRKKEIRQKTDELFEFAGGHSEHRFAQGVAFETIAEVTHGAYRHDDVDARVELAQTPHEGRIAGRDFVGRDHTAVECGGRQAVAVVDHLAGGFLFKDEGGAPREYQRHSVGEVLAGLGKAPVEQLKGALAVS